MVSSWGFSIIKCVLTITLATLLISVTSSKGELDAETLFYLRLRPRLGHFPDVDGYLNIFEDYFNNTIRLNDKKLAKLDINDWRNVRPTGELCVDFLQSFQVKRYKLSKPHGIIALDACLGWLYDTSDEKEEDIKRFTIATRTELLNIEKDTKLAKIYKSTSFIGDKVPQKTKDSVYEYLIKLLRIYADNPRNGCHGLWIETYTDFIEDVYLGDCDNDEECLYFGYEGATEDSYLNLIVESTKQSSITCYGVMQKQVKRIMQQAYETEMAYSEKLTKKIKAATTRVDKQSEAMMWGKDMTRILQLVSDTNPDEPINLAQVVKDLNKLRVNDEETVERFTTAIGKYAIQNVNLKDSANDPEGRARFGKAVTKLCKAYINPQLFLAQTGGSTLWQDPNENKNPFEFYNIVYGLIRLTNHFSIYRISKDKFENDVLKNNWESLYLTTFACQLISITWGELDYDTNEEAYAVSFRPNDGEDLIEDWPLHVMLEKITDTASKFKGMDLNEPTLQQVNSQRQQPETEKKFLPEAQESAQHQPPKRVETAPVEHAPKKEHKIHFPFKLKGFSLSKSKSKNTEAPVTSAPAPKSAPVTTPEPELEPEPTTTTTPAPPKPVMSLESIEMYKDMHGRYPSLPPNIHEIYPSLPKNLDGVFPKNLAKWRPTAKPRPTPAPRPDFGYNPYGQNSYGSYGSYGGNSFGSNYGNQESDSAPKRQMKLVF